MKNTQVANQIEATLGFAATFIFKLFSFTLLFSIVPLLFVNLPLRMLFINVESLYTPLMWLANFLSVFFSGALTAKLIPKVLFSHQPPLAPPALKITESTLRYTSTEAGTRVFVVGKTENSSGTDAARVWFRVNLLGVEGQVLDTLLVDQSGLVVPTLSTKTFRVTGLVSVKPEEVNSAEVEIERSSERSRYD